MITEAPDINVIKSAEGRARLRARSAERTEDGKPRLRLRTHGQHAAEAARIAKKSRDARRRPR